MIKQSKWENGFLGSSDAYDEADIVIVGAPMDYTVSYRPGTRFGPQSIREASYSIEEYSPYLDKDLNSIRFFDYGDLILPFGDVEGSLGIIQRAAADILKDNKKPLFIGGEHLVSAPIVHSVYDKYNDELYVVHFDAHADLRDEFFGGKNSHACAVRRMTDFLNPTHIYQFGIRSGAKEEFEYAALYTHMYKFDVLEPLKACLDELKGKPVYVTLDIDVVDPASANGTGTPEPGGCSSKEIIGAIHAMQGLNIVGFDIVEVSPNYDLSNRTAILAAKIIREALLALL